jgi:acetylornithine deacetylase/succinyl-diaminopimelate desuccinylase-like protein
MPVSGGILSVDHRARGASATDRAPELPRRLRLGPELGLGGGPELGLTLVLVVVLAMGAGAAREARAIWPFDGALRAPLDALFDRGPVSTRAAGLLAEAIRIPTANPPGNEKALAVRYAQELRRSGIETRVIDTPGPEAGPARAAVWARVPSAAPEGERRPALALLSHLDTVPATPEEWSVDPWAGEIWDGLVWGRGALDAKGVGVAHLLAMVAIAESGMELDRDLILLATPEEETGGRLGAGWLVEHHPELLEGVGYLLTEGGGIQLPHDRDQDRAPIWGVTLTEKSPCWLELRASGRAGHSSAPTPDAAVPRLVAALDRIRRLESPIRIVPEVAQMFTALAPIAAEWDRAGFVHLAEHLESDEGFRRRFLGNPGQNALVRNTISITVLEGAAKTNVAPPEARAQLDARLLPGEQCDAFASAIRSLVDDDSIEIAELLSFPAIASTQDTPLYRAIERVAERQARPGLVVPRMIGGFTDAHWFREKGIVAYGFVPRALSTEESRRIHGLDERVAIDTLTESIRLTIEIARALDVEERTPR